MKSPIIFNLDKKIKYIIIYLIVSFRILYFESKHFLDDLCLLFCFIISLICLYLTNKRSKINNEIKNKNTNIKEYFYIILVYFLLNIIPFLRDISKKDIYLCYSNITFIGIIIIGFFKKETFFNHQIISLNILFLIMPFSPSFKNNYKTEKIHQFIINSIFSSLYYYSQGILRGYFKYSMENKFISPFFISSINVGMNLIKNILVKVYKYFILNKEINYFNFKIEGTYEIIKCILFICCGISIPIFDILICYFYSPYHQCVCDIFSNTFLRNSFELYDIIIGTSNLFFSCVASEIIILKFCDLDKNTKIEIRKRAYNTHLSDLIETFQESSIEMRK